MILCYHDVDPEWRSPLAVTPEEFRRQCQWLAAHRQVVPLTRLVERLDERVLPPSGQVALTFDDGFRGVHQHALPVLAEHGWTATVFVVTATLGPEGHPVDWVDGEPPGTRQTLTPSQVGELVAAGLDVQSHTSTHRDLTAISESDALDDLKRSKGDLEDLLSRPVDQLAYPRGRHDGRVRRSAATAGFEWAFTLPEHREHRDRLAVPRVGIFPGNGPRTLAAKTRPAYLAFRHSAFYPWVRRLAGRG